MRRSGWPLFVLVLAGSLAVPTRSYADAHLLVITGVAGDEQHAAQFSRWAAALVEAAVAHGVPAANVVYLGDGSDPRLRGRATRANVTGAFQDVAARAQADDEVVIVLIGHGSYDGRTGAFNLPGPDLSAEDYAKLLRPIRSQHVGFVNTSGASGAFLGPLAGPGRAVITATATGGERNDTRFPEYFVEAFTSDAADRDHDGRVSLLEAFEYARGRVAEIYKRDGLLQSEHATLQDGADGAFAATLVLGGAPTVATEDPALRTLVDERRQLELKVATLRQRKGTMDPNAYDAELERLLVALATKTRAIQQLQGKK